MSQLVDITITNRGASLDLLPGGPTLYGFDVKDIVSPIRYSSGLSKSYFTARTNKGGVNDNHNGSKIDYQSSDSLAVIAAKSPLFLLLNVVSRRGVDGNNEAYIFVSSKITESLVPTPDGTLFYYIEDGDPLPVEYIVSQSVATIISMSVSSPIAIQDRGVNMPLETKLNFIGYTVEDNPGLSTDVYNIKDETWTKLNTMKTAGVLPVGAWYRITDRYNYQSGATGIIPNKSFLGDDRGYVYIRAITPTSFSKDVIRVMAVPKSYSTVLNAQTSISIWNNSWKTTLIGQVAIWGGRVFKSLTNAIGTSTDYLNLDVVNWVLQGKQAFPLNYTDVQFSAKYDFDNDWFEEQRDEKGNRFGLTFVENAGTFNFLFNPVDICDWNRETSTVNTVFRNNRNIGVWNNSNSDPIIGGLSLGTIMDNSNSGHISNNFGIFIVIKNNSNTGNIRENYTNGTSGSAVNIDNNTNLGSINNNKINTGISKNSINGNISNNELGTGISDCTTDGTLNDISGVVEPTGGIDKNVLYNNFPASTPYTYYSADVTGSTDIFMNGLCLNGSENSKLLLVSTNPTETINTVTIFPQNKKSKMFVAPGLVVTFVHGTGADQPRLEGGINAVLDGNNGDWIEFEERGGAIYQTNIGTY